MGVFSKSSLPDSKLKRNNFSLSFQNNLTTNFGVLKPVFCKEVIEGDTWDIDSTVSLRFMPTVFPIQNRCRATIKFFYVRKRALYEDFKEWYTGNVIKEKQSKGKWGLPTLNFDKLGTSDSPFKNYEDFLRFMQLGGLADSFGIPVSQTLSADAYKKQVISPTATLTTDGQEWSDSASATSNVWSVRYCNAPLALPFHDYSKSDGVTLEDFPTDDDGRRSLISRNAISPRFRQVSANQAYLSINGPLGVGLLNNAMLLTTVGNFSSGGDAQRNIVPFLASSAGLTIQGDLDDWICGKVCDNSNNQAISETVTMYSPAFWTALQQHFAVYPVIVSASIQSGNYELSSPHIYALGSLAQDGIATLKIPDNVDWSDLPPLPFDPKNPPSNLGRSPFIGLLCVARSSDSFMSLFPPTSSSTQYSTTLAENNYNNSAYLDPDTYVNGDSYYFSGLFTLPYSQSRLVAPLIWQACQSPDLFYHPLVETPISALPFRAYELIYNSFYRDNRNNPYTIKGQKYYDRFLPSLEGGRDTEDYRLHYVNWYQDQFTTALPSPQQGAAPLVGITSTGVATLYDMDSESLVNVKLQTDESGDQVISYSSRTTDGDEFSPSVHQTLINAATSGISINDFRNVNSFQRFLEKNMRQGLRYKDLVQARWGVSPSYSELNMPEFIGGMIQEVIPAQVNQQSQDTSSSPLGSYAGQLYCSGSQRHKIHKFCDESGYIIGIMDVTPSPVYDSLMPKHFFKSEQLDFFQPEFGHIGLQEIPIRELALNACSGLVGDHVVPLRTFGYQRAWYDYLTSNDEVHGQFRTTLKDFCIHREFANAPTLSEEFLLVSDSEANNIFSVQTDADGNEVDKILGQIYFDVKAKRPIPRFGIPRLE